MLPRTRLLKGIVLFALEGCICTDPGTPVKKYSAPGPVSIFGIPEEGFRKNYRLRLSSELLQSMHISA